MTLTRSAQLRGQKHKLGLLAELRVRSKDAEQKTNDTIFELQQLFDNSVIAGRGWKIFMEEW